MYIKIQGIKNAYLRPAQKKPEIQSTQHSNKDLTPPQEFKNSRSGQSVHMLENTAPTPGTAQGQEFKRGRGRPKKNNSGQDLKNRTKVDNTQGAKKYEDRRGDRYVFRFKDKNLKIYEITVASVNYSILLDEPVFDFAVKKFNLLNSLLRSDEYADFYAKGRGTFIDFLAILSDDLNNKKDNTPTLSQVIKAWLKMKESSWKSPSARRAFKAQADKIIKSLGHFKICCIVPANCFNFIDEHIKGTNSLHTGSMLNTMLKQIFFYAMEKWPHFINSNPITWNFSQRFGKPRPIKKNSLYDPAELKELIKNMEESFLKTSDFLVANKYIYHFALFCPLRIGNILNLKWKNIKFAHALDSRVKKETPHGYIFIPSSETKNNEDFFLPLSPTLEKILLIIQSEQKEQPSDYIFVNKAINKNFVLEKMAAEFGEERLNFIKSNSLYFKCNELEAHGFKGGIQINKNDLEKFEHKGTLFSNPITYRRPGYDTVLHTFKKTNSKLNITPHATRKIFSTFLNEFNVGRDGDFIPNDIERCLGHAHASKIEHSYNYSRRLGAMFSAMNEWDSYLHELSGFELDKIDISPPTNDFKLRSETIFLEAN